jgi:hypothetical protein
MDGYIENMDRDRAKLLLSTERWEKIKWVDRPWPREWPWIQFPLCYMDALKECTGDWVLVMPIDQIFHENDLSKVREFLNKTEAPLATFQKYSFVTWNKFFQKGEYPLALNMRLYPDLGFGKAQIATDLAYPIMVQGKGEDGLPYGITVPDNMRAKSGIPFYNYDCTFRTKEVEKDIFWRASKAKHSYTGIWDWGETEDMAFKFFIDMMNERYSRCVSEIKLEEHPKYIREKLAHLIPKQFGYNRWR